MGFKSCPRVGGIDEVRVEGRQTKRFQVVPPCGGHPSRWALPMNRMRVSSRAPVWGASYGIYHCKHSPKVSSRAPVWGASNAGERLQPRSKSFKSCPRVGGILLFSYSTLDEIVSSRAPVWGASRACVQS